MKRILTAIMALCLLFGTTLNASANVGIDYLLTQLSDNKEVSTVYISQAMLRSISGGKVSNLPVARYAYSIENVQVYTCPSEQTSKEAMKIVKKYLIENPSLETMMKVKDAESETAIYAMPKKKGSDEYSQLVLFTYSKSESTLIVINGNLSRYNIGDLAGRGIKNIN